MAVPQIAVPPGVKHVVGLLLTDPTVGDPSFLPGSIGAASSSSFSTGLPVYPVILEGPGSNGSVSRTIFGVNDSSNQTIGAAGSGNGLGLGMVLNVPYPYDPSQLAFGNRQLTRATGGLLDVVNPLYSEGAATDDDGERAGQDIRAFLYAEDQDDALQAIRLQATAAGALTVDAAAVIPATITSAADIVLAAAVGATLFGVNTSRSLAIVQNLGAGTVRVGDATVAAAIGIELAVGESVSLETTALIEGFSTAGATVTVTEIEA